MTINKNGCITKDVHSNNLSVTDQVFIKKLTMSDTMKISNFRLYGLLGLITTLSSQAKIEPLTYQTEVRVELRATVLAPVCKINDDKALDVNFNEINPDEIDGTTFAITKTVKLDCPSNTDKLYPFIEIKGTRAGFEGADINVLRVDGGFENMGIALFKGTEPRADKLTLNQWMELKLADVEGSQFTFTAVPVKKSGTTLGGGVFSASATMKLEYR